MFHTLNTNQGKASRWLHLWEFHNFVGANSGRARTLEHTIIYYKLDV